MDDPSADVFRPVEYSRDRWRMSRMPGALLMLLGGLVIVVYVDPRPVGPAALGGLTVLLVGAAITIGIDLVVHQARSARMLLVRGMAAGLLMLLVASMIVAIASGEVKTFKPRIGSPAPAGWICVLIGVAWIAYTAVRRLLPGRPMLALSPEGIGFGASPAGPVLVPWHVVEAVDAFEQKGAMDHPFRFEDVTAVLISKSYCEEHLAPLGARIAAGLVPRGEAMQLVLRPDTFALPPEAIRKPIEARWRAFAKGRTRPGAPTTADAPTPLVLGRWSYDGSSWQLVTLVVPLLAVLIVMVDATGLLPH